MSALAIIMWLVVLVVGLPSAWRNPTAGALSLAWLGAQVIYLATGDNLPTIFYCYSDVFVIMVIMAKTQPYGCPDDGDTRHHLRSTLLNRSGADRIIMAIFPVMWVFYAVDIDEYYRWRVLCALEICQFLTAGWEAFSIHRRVSRATVKVSEPPFAEYRAMWEGLHARFRLA